MKGVLVLAASMLFSLLGTPARSLAQSYEVEQLILDVQKLTELKQILQDLKDGYQVLDKGYSAIRDISQGNFNLHKAFLDGLLAVSPAVRSYKRIADILNLQGSLLSRYKAAWSKFQQDGHFSPDEISLMGNVYANLFSQSLNDLDALADIVTDGQMRASDAERISQIDGIYSGMQQKSVFLDQFNGSAVMLSMQRAADGNDLMIIQKLYGINTQ